jgi:outer membrane protein TolC
MGESPDKQITLDDSGFNAFEAPMDLGAAVDEALRSRPEMKAEENKVRVAHMNASSTEAERLPSIRAIANYGNTGNTSQFIPTDAVGLQLTLPLFDGGLRSAHRAMAASQTRQAETRRRDVHDEIEVEVRIAVDNLRSAREQLTAANETLRLAEEEIEQAQLRFGAQVTTQIDVIAAQAQLAEARTRRVDAAYTVSAGEVEYRRAVGKIINLDR